MLIAEYQDAQELIDGFINAQVIRRGLDERTGEAYRIDLEHFYQWLREMENLELLSNQNDWQKTIERYLKYLIQEKGLRSSTVTRKYRVFNYYLSYLVKQGFLIDSNLLKKKHIDFAENTDGRFTVEKTKDVDCANERMSKKDVDAFFLALEREYEKLDSEFRKRVCLRDLVMMKLLFYHGIEISELLRLKITDYDKKSGVLTVWKKREKVKKIYLYSKKLREAIDRWIAEHGYFERETDCQNIMFLSKLGKPLSMKMVINIFDKYRILAGIEKEITPKELKRCMGEYAKELMREQCG